VELPGPLYCDTSALLKLYLREPESPAFMRLVQERDDLLVSDLAVTEIASALSRRVRHGAVTAEQAVGMQRDVIESLMGPPYQHVDLTREVHRRAEHQLLTLTKTPLRASDALHLASALSGRAASMAAFDARLAAAARAAGLAVYPA
jgi:predicted nucleic acid-binding protein